MIISVMRLWGCCRLNFVFLMRWRRRCRCRNNSRINVWTCCWYRRRRGTGRTNRDSTTRILRSRLPITVFISNCIDINRASLSTFSDSSLSTGAFICTAIEEYFTNFVGFVSNDASMKRRIDWSFWRRSCWCTFCFRFILFKSSLFIL